MAMRAIRHKRPRTTRQPGDRDNSRINCLFSFCVDTSVYLTFFVSFSRLPASPSLPHCVAAHLLLNNRRKSDLQGFTFAPLRRCDLSDGCRRNYALRTAAAASALRYIRLCRSHGGWQGLLALSPLLCLRRYMISFPSSSTLIQSSHLPPLLCAHDDTRKELVPDKPGGSSSAYQGMIPRHSLHVVKLRMRGIAGRVLGCRSDNERTR